MALELLVRDTTHGQRSRYISGCRCLQCRAANSRYKTGWVAMRKDSERCGLVSARNARKHLLSLKRAGVGSRLVSEVSGLSRAVIRQVRSGEKKAIRAGIERQILAVDRHAKNAASLVPAKMTWKRIDELLEEGFTEWQLAELMGFSSGKLQFGTELVSAKTEQRVAQLYGRIMDDGAPAPPKETK